MCFLAAALLVSVVATPPAQAAGSLEATTSGINATLAADGHITGTVKNASAAGVANIYVYAYRCLLYTSDAADE